MESLPKGVSARRTRQGILVLRTHYSADPDRGPEWVKTERAKYSSEGSWLREQEIVHEAGGGELVFFETLNRWKDKIIITDPDWVAPPTWKPVPGFDHGKTNPTAALVARVDYDGVIYLCGEYYMPGLGPADHAPNLRRLPGFFEAENVQADPSIFYKSQAQNAGKFKSVAELYDEVGVSHLAPGRNEELLGMERILHHWRDIENREPTLKIVCRMPYDRKTFGLFPTDCPNTIWELLRTRREKLTAVQLMRKNPSESIVDRDNHLRDCLKAICLSLPDPTDVPREMQMERAIKDRDPLNAFIQQRKLESTFKQEDSPNVSGGLAKRRGLINPPTRKW